MALTKVVYVIRHGTAVHNVRFKQKDVVFKDLILQRSKTKADRDNRSLFPEIEEWAYMTSETWDTSLVQQGIEEARSLGESWANGSALLYDEKGKTAIPMPLALKDIELVVSSPLTRTLQTSMNILFHSRLDSKGKQQFVPRWSVDMDVNASCLSRESAPDVRSASSCVQEERRIIALDVIKEWSQGRHTPNRRQEKADLSKAYPHVDFSELNGELDSLWSKFWPNTSDGLEPFTHLQGRVERFKKWLLSRPEQNIVVVSHGTFLGNFLFGRFADAPENEMHHCKIYRSTLTSDAGSA